MLESGNFKKINWTGRCYLEPFQLITMLWSTMNKLLLLILVLSPLAQGYEFYSGKKTYSTQTASDQISQEYGHQFQLTTIVVVASSEKHPLYIEQWNQLEMIDAEALQLIYVSSKVSSEEKHGYYTNSDTAKEILAGSDFRVLVISPAGKELENNQAVVSGAEIKRLAQSHNKASNPTP